MNDPAMIEAIRKHPPRMIKPEQRYLATKKKQMYLLKDILGPDHPQVSYA